nr:hypothetical protein [Tanacetum cinerariifolium]
MIFLLQKDVCDDIGITTARLSNCCCQANIVIFEAVIREILQLNDAEGVVCLPNVEIFTGLAQMGYEKSSTIGRVRAEQVQVDDAVVADVVEDVVEDVAEDVAQVATPSPPPHGIPSPPQEPSSPPQQPHVTPSAPTQGEAFPATFQQVLDTCFALLRRIEHLEHDNVAQRLEIVKLKARVKKLEQTDKVKSLKFRRLRKVGASRQVESSDDMEDVFNQGRMMNEDEGIELVKDAEIAESEGRQADKQEEIYNINLDHSSKVLSMQEDDSKVQDVVEVVTTAKLITKVVTAAANMQGSCSKRLIGIMMALTRILIGMLQWIMNDLCSNFSNLSSQAAKRRKLSEEAQEAEDLRKRLEVVEDEDDNVFVEATPLAQKVPVVDYQIVLIDNKPRYKIIKADDTHQLYISFTTLLKNFNREDLETLWRIVRDRCSTLKPTSFSDEYLLMTLRTMFEEPNGQD